MDNCGKMEQTENPRGDVMMPMQTHSHRRESPSCSPHRNDPQSTDDTTKPTPTNAWDEREQNHDSTRNDSQGSETRAALQPGMESPTNSEHNESSSERSATSSTSSAESSDDDAVFAFESALLADIATGKTLSEAVQALFDNPDETMTSRERTRIRALNLSAPILGAIAANPDLEDDIHTIATMCQTVYELAEDDITAFRTQRAPERTKFEAKSLDDVANVIEAASKIVVLTGAGISVSCGIPDFRSKGGLYDAISSEYEIADPQLVFDFEEFRYNPQLFYSVARHIIPSRTVEPSATHRFIAELHRRKKLLRNYSQNIDGLERMAGIPDSRVMLCHGSVQSATCMRKTCRAKVAMSDPSICDDAKVGKVPRCPTCKERTAGKSKGTSRDSKRMRYMGTRRRKFIRDKHGDGSDESEEDDEIGVMKPDIVFFGEGIPTNVADNMERDIHDADLVLVVGTSLKVRPISLLPRYFQDDVVRMLINREAVGYDFDVEMLGDCDVIVNHLQHVLGWDCEGADGDGEKTALKESNDDKDSAVFVPPSRFLFQGAGRDVQGNTTIPLQDEQM